MFKAVIFICLAFCCPALSEPDSISYDNSRLPKALQPEHYKIKIKTHLNDENGFKFIGEEIITFKVLEDASNITLHAKILKIDKSKIFIWEDENSKRNESDDLMPAESTEVIPKHDYYVIHLSKPLTKGKIYKVEIHFEGELSKSLHGYYRSSYIDKQTNATRWLAITQFEPTHAREAFPCFDEPEMKAKFDITIGHRKNYTALSNMPLKLTKEMSDDNDWVWDQFEESTPMSTYIVAYSVNDFEYIESESNTENKIQFRTWARPDAKSQAQYASEIGPKVLKFYEEQFDIEYPLPKMDQIAIPDFSAGAMENWGLVTYRETALLYAQNVSSGSNKHRIAEVVSHEFAHQWFGNLVTMKWWTDLWLNEGFATYVASLGVDYLHPEWNSLSEESVSNTLAIFEFDALKSSHPISVEIKDASQISQIFDAISYSKGSCVIRMMHLFLGEPTFRSGISNYLKKYSYSNAEQDNLWSAITDVAHEQKSMPDSFTVKQVMDSWTLQTGYPIVTVTRDYDSGTAKIEQSRYLLDSNVLRNDLENCWWIPLSYTTESIGNFNSTQPQKWLECNDKEPIPTAINSIANSDEWVIFNIQLSGLYKVKYDEKNWDLLIDTLTSPDYKKIHEINRAQLIDDALDLAWTGDMDYNVAMRIIGYLKQEREYIPWKAAMSNLISVKRILSSTSKYGQFKKYMKILLTPIYAALGGLNPVESNSEKLSMIKHKVMIASWSCRFEVGDCVSKSQEYFDKWQNSENPDKINPIPVDLRSVVYCTTIRNGGEDVWKFLWEQYTKSNVATEKQTILAALGCTREIWLLQRYLGWCFDEQQGIRKQDSFIAFSAIARSDVGFHLARDYLFDNFESIHKYYSPETSRLSRLFKPIAEKMYTHKNLIMMKEFTAKYKSLLEKANEGVKRSLETIEINSQWVERNFKDFSRNLLKYV